jgi:thymidylate kinase
LHSNEYPFLTDLFNTINKLNITYCVLRNYDTLPYDTNGSDIDIFIDPNNFHMFHETIKNIAQKYGGEIISVLNAYNVIDIAIMGNYNGNNWGIRFDTFTYIGTNDCTILTNKFVIDRIELHNGIKVANYHDAIIVAFTKEIIGAKKYDKRYSDEAIKFFKKEKDIYKNEFLNVLPQNTVNNILTPLLMDEISFTKEISNALFTGYRKKHFEVRKLAYLYDLYMIYKYKFKRLIVTPGFSIAFLGTDGSGKSTIIENIIPFLEKPLHNKILYSHMRPNMVPNIGMLFGKTMAANEIQNPHTAKSSGFIGSLMRLGYYGFDYIVGYWRLVHIRLAQKTTIWIFDRYCYDYLIDPKRTRINLPGWIVKGVIFFFPKPNLILCLGAKPEIIHERKLELPFDEVVKQVEKLKYFSDHEKKAVWIDTGKSLDESVNQTLKTIKSKMASRYS